MAGDESRGARTITTYHDWLRACQCVQAIRPAATILRVFRLVQGHQWCGVVWCGVVWCGVVWCGVVWCGVVWCGVVWCGVVWCGVVWCGVVWCGVVRCGAVRCGVVWCGVVWCGRVWCGVEEEEEEEERVPRSHGRWALASSPGGPTQTSPGSPSSYLR